MKIDENLYLEIKTLIEQSRNIIVKSVNWAMVISHWEIGKRIIEEEQKGLERAVYGKFLIKNLSNRLNQEFGSGFEERELRKMRQFYIGFPIRDAVRPELTWTHYRLLLRVEDATARAFYLKESIEEGWSSRQLDRQISSFYYQRLQSSQDKNLLKSEVDSTNDPMKPADFLKEPFVLFDLKIGTLTPQDVGQMDMYVRLYENQKKPLGDNPTLGIILCSERDDTVVQFSVLNGSEQLFASQYQLYLPTAEQLKLWLENQRLFLELKKGAEE